MSQTYAVLSAAAREKAQAFIRNGGRMDDIQMSDDPLAVDYRALQEQADAEVLGMYKRHWDTKGILRNQFLAVPSMLGPVMRVAKQRPL
jgi:hypothetical protein